MVGAEPECPWPDPEGPPTGYRVRQLGLSRRAALRFIHYLKFDRSEHRHP
jgi:hypothetical protein